MRSYTIRSMAAAAGVCLLLTGCWLQPGFNGAHTRTNTVENQLTVANVATMQQAWSIDLAGNNVSEPLISGSSVYVTYGESLTWGAQSIDTATGVVRWDRTLTSADAAFVETRMPLTFVGGELWTSWAEDASGTCGGHLARLNPADGTVVGTQPMIPISPPTVAGDHFAQVHTTVNDCSVVTGDVDLMVGDVDGASTVWSTHLEGSAWSFPQPMVASDRVFIPHPFEGASAYPLDRCDPAPTPGTCTPIWTVESYDRSVSGRPLVGGPSGQLFVAAGVSLPGTTDGQVLVISQDTGAVLWRAPYDATQAEIAVSRDRLYVAASGSGAGAGTLLAFDVNGCGTTICAPLWTASLGTTTASAPTVAGGVIYAATSGGEIRAYDAAGCGATTCSAVASVTVAGDVRTMSVGEGHLLVTSRATGGPATVTAFAPTA